VAVVLVDAENVRRSRWPNVGREELVELCRSWAAAESHDVVVVFDGTAPAVASRPGVEVIGSGSESADDRLVREASERSQAGEVWLATSDRALRRAAEASVDRVLGGGSFLAQLG
jgi:predicted RNA-binding protein with PIN domain